MCVMSECCFSLCFIPFFTDVNENDAATLLQGALNVSSLNLENPNQCAGRSGGAYGTASLNASGRSKVWRLSC